MSKDVFYIEIKKQFNLVKIAKDNIINDKNDEINNLRMEIINLNKLLEETNSKKLNLFQKIFNY